MILRPGAQSGTVVHAGLLVDVLDVGLHGRQGDEKHVGRFLRGLSLHDKGCDFFFPRGEYAGHGRLHGGISRLPLVPAREGKQHASYARDTERKAEDGGGDAQQVEVKVKKYHDPVQEGRGECLCEQEAEPYGPFTFQKPQRGVHQAGAGIEGERVQALIEVDERVRGQEEYVFQYAGQRERRQRAEKADGMSGRELVAHAFSVTHFVRVSKPRAASAQEAKRIRPSQATGSTSFRLYTFCSCVELPRNGVAHQQ